MTSYKKALDKDIVEAYERTSKAIQELEKLAQANGYALFPAQETDYGELWFGISKYGKYRLMLNDKPLGNYPGCFRLKVVPELMDEQFWQTARGIR
jgi:hypothetical protein